jgi:hypothetical protein
MPDDDENTQNNATMVAVAQNLVAAVNNLNNTVSATFPNWVTVPTSSSDSGVAGQTAYDTSYFYWCISSNSWLRTTGTTF